MPTQCRPVSFGFQGCQGRKVTAAFDGGAITSNAGAGATPLSRTVGFWG